MFDNQTGAQNQTEFLQYLNPIQPTIKADYQEKALEQTQKIFDEKEKLSNQMCAINSTLGQLGLPVIGDLFSNSIQSVKITLSSIAVLIHQVQKDFESKKENLKNYKALELDFQNQDIVLNKIQKEKNSLENQLQDLKNKCKLEEQQFSQERSKLTLLLDETQKQLQKNIQKEQQLKNEVNKQESVCRKLQEQIKKLGEKNANTQYLNTFEIEKTLPMKVLENEDTSNLQEEIALLIKGNYQKVFMKLQSENQFFREQLAHLNTELENLMKIRQKIFLQRAQLYPNYEQIVQDPTFQINEFALNSSMFNMPVEITSNQLTEMFESNIQKFKIFMNKIDQLEEMHDPNINSQDIEKEMDKVQSLSDLKNIHYNYKNIIEKQMEAMQKIGNKMKDNITKGNQDMNEFSQTNFEQNQLQLEKAKKYLAEQKQLVQQKAEEIEQFKQKLSSSQNKLINVKQNFDDKRTELEQDNKIFLDQLSQAMKEQTSKLSDMFSQGNNENDQ